MKWKWLIRRHPDPGVCPDLDAKVQGYVDAADARQEAVDHVLRETRRQNRTNNFGPKVASALGARPR